MSNVKKFNALEPVEKLQEIYDKLPGKYLYIAYAEDEAGTGYTESWNDTKVYIAVLVSATEIPNRNATTYAGLWRRFQGIQGEQGADGDNWFRYEPGPGLYYPAGRIDIHDQLAGGVVITSLDPFAIDGPAEIAYLLDTLNTLTDPTARILSIRNNGSEIFGVNPDGSVSVVGDLHIDDTIHTTGNISIQGPTNVMISGSDTGATFLYNSGSAKLATFSNGVQITGQLLADNLLAGPTINVMCYNTTNGQFQYNGGPNDPLYFLSSTGSWSIPAGAWATAIGGIEYTFGNVGIGTSGTVTLPFEVFGLIGNFVASVRNDHATGNGFLVSTRSIPGTGYMFAVNDSQLNDVLFAVTGGGNVWIGNDVVATSVFQIEKNDGSSYPMVKFTNTNVGVNAEGLYIETTNTGQSGKYALKVKNIGTTITTEFNVSTSGSINMIAPSTNVTGIFTVTEDVGIGAGPSQAQGSTRVVHVSGQRPSLRLDGSYGEWQFLVDGTSVGSNAFRLISDGTDRIKINAAETNIYAPNGGTMLQVQQDIYFMWNLEANYGTPVPMLWDSGVTARVSYDGTSDIRLKENVRPLEADSLAIINGTEVKRFDWIDGENDQLGIIAQDLQALDQSLVVSGQKDDYLIVLNMQLRWHYHKAIQQLTQRIEALENK